MRTLQLIVRSVSELKPSKYEYQYHYIIFKNVDETDDTKYILNLQKKDGTKQDRQIYSNWFNNAKPGAVLEVVMQEKYPKNVNQFKPFKVIKRHNEGYKKAQERGQEVFESPNDAGQLSLGIHLEKMENFANGILQEIKTIKEDFSDKL